MAAPGGWWQILAGINQPSYSVSVMIWCFFSGGCCLADINMKCKGLHTLHHSNGSPTCPFPKPYGSHSSNLSASGLPANHLSHYSPPKSPYSILRAHLFPHSVHLGTLSKALPLGGFHCCFLGRPWVCNSLLRHAELTRPCNKSGPFFPLSASHRRTFMWPQVWTDG